MAAAGWMTIQDVVSGLRSAGTRRDPVLPARRFWKKQNVFTKQYKA
jgi:hypothetical protein